MWTQSSRPFPYGATHCAGCHHPRAALLRRADPSPIPSASSQGCRDPRAPRQGGNGALHTHLPSRRSLRGPYLSMTIPKGSVMALSRKEPTVKAKFSISSWALQEGHLCSEAVLFFSSELLVVVSARGERGERVRVRTEAGRREGKSPAGHTPSTVQFLL